MGGPVAGMLASEPFMASLALVLAGLGFLIVVISLIAGMTNLRKIGSGFVLGGLVLYVLLF